MYFQVSLAGSYSAPSENSSPNPLSDPCFCPPQMRTSRPVQAATASDRGASGERAMRRHLSPAGS
jgi:hypothetical protein